MGLRDVERPRKRVTLAEPVKTRGWLTHFYRAVLEATEDGGWSAKLTGPQGSGILTSMARADALLKVPADCELSAGAEVEAIFLRDL